MRNRDRRSFVLIAVLVIVTVALLVATALLVLVQAEHAGAVHARRELQSRAIARGGIDRIVAALDRQRDRIRDGDLPRLDEQYTIHESPQGYGVVRLLPVGADGARLAPEAGRLDLNTCTAGALAATDLVDEDLAQRIVAWRDAQGTVHSVAALLAVDGVTPELLYGPLDDVRPRRQAQGDDPGIAARVGARLAGGAPRGLADAVTVYAVEPALQRDGRRRIPLDVGWSDELARRLGRRGNDDVDRALATLLQRDGAIDSLGAAVQSMQNVELPPERWGELLDRVTSSPDGLVYGRLDVNHAPAAALRAVEGLDADQARRIVDVRDALAPADRASPAWLVTGSIVEPSEFAALADAVTCRSWTYRVRLAAGIVDPDDPDERLTSPVIYELVVDLVDPRPRIAYLRDVTDLEITARLAEGVEVAVDDEAAPPRDRGEPPVAGPRDDAPGAEPPSLEMPGRDPAPEAARSEPVSPDPRDPGASGLRQPVMPDPDAMIAPAADPEMSSPPLPRAPRRGERVGRWRGSGEGAR